MCKFKDMISFWNWINTHNWITTLIFGLLTFGLGIYISSSERAQENRPILYTKVEATRCPIGDLDLVIRTVNHGNNLAHNVTGVIYILEPSESYFMKGPFEARSFIPKGEGFTVLIACTHVSDLLYVIQQMQYQDMITDKEYSDDYKAYKIVRFRNEYVNLPPEQKDFAYIDSIIKNQGDYTFYPLNLSYPRFPESGDNR